MIIKINSWPDPISGIISIVLLFAWFDQGLHDRIARDHKLSACLGFQRVITHPPLKAGYEFASQNLFFGIGPKILSTIAKC